jgi:hypothetical protein
LHAQPASRMSDEVLRKRHSTAVISLLDRHYRMLQPLWDAVLLTPGPLQKKIQFEVSQEIEGRPGNLLASVEYPHRRNSQLYVSHLKLE